MVNYLEKIFCIEVLEKISRMNRFLRSETSSSGHKGNEVVSVFLKVLNVIIENLKPTIKRLSEEIILDEWDRLATMRDLSIIFNSVDKLHLRLQFIYGKWVRPETHVFLKSILEFIPKDRRPEKVSIILSNLYSFLETDLSSYFEDVLSTTDVRVNFQDKNPSVFMPKIELDNPLNWAILVHECGHIDSQGISNLLKRKEIVSIKVDTHNREIFQSWVEEIYCDIFATRILGPAYLASFVTFALLVGGAGGSEIATEKHPPDVVRISIIQDVLEKSNLKVGLSEPRLNCNDLSSLFFNILEERTKLDRQYVRSPRKQPQLQLKFGEFIDVICEQVDNIISLSRQLTMKDFARINGLAKRLSNKVPIGAYQNSQLTDSAIASFLKGRTDKQKLNNAKSAIQESRVLPWEIVNAGWIHKIEDIYPNAFKIFFVSDDTPIEEKVINWGEDLGSIDRLLLKSIESSEIQRLIEGE